MANTSNLTKVGSSYTITDVTNGNVVGNIQIISHKDILSAACGVYDETKFASFTDYMEQSIKKLSGFTRITDTFWYTTSEDSIILSELISYAFEHGYKKVIVEQISEK